MNFIELREIFLINIRYYISDVTSLGRKTSYDILREGRTHDPFMSLSMCLYRNTVVSENRLNFIAGRDLCEAIDLKNATELECN